MSRKKTGALQRHRVASTVSAILLSAGLAIGGASFAQPAFAIDGTTEQQQSQETGNDLGEHEQQSQPGEASTEQTQTKGSVSDVTESGKTPEGKSEGKAVNAVTNGDSENQQGEAAADYSEVTAIYLNGQTGDDSKDGLTADNAVKTFAKAKEIAAANQNIVTIYVTGTVEVSGDVSLDGTNAILQREKDFKGDLLSVNGEATLKSITVDGNNGVTSSGSLVDVGSGTLNIGEAAKLVNNKANKAAVYATSGTINMTAGEISNNTSSSWGGGVTVWGSGTVKLSGGSIDGNSGSAGGGLYLRGSSKDQHAHFNMTGGQVNNNVSGGYGGGIYVGASTEAEVSAGDICYNQEKGNAWGGGGIYVNSDEKQPNLYSNGVLHVYNAEMTGNETTGGVAGYDSVLSSCDTGKVDVSLTDGTVIHDNGAANTVLVYRQQSSSSYQISPIMLGGAPYNWVDEKGEAYAPGAISFTNDNLGWNYAKTSVSAANGTVSGLNRVKVHINNNKSTYLGAAIGTNGDVYIGKSDGDVTLNISKRWNDGSDKKSHDPVTVNIDATDGMGTKTTIGKVTLSDENDWKTTVNHLPELDSDGNHYTYSVSETKDGYITSVSDGNKEAVGKASNEFEYNFEVTNTEATSFTFTKVWHDAGNKDGIRPSTDDFASKLTLEANGSVAKDAEGKAFAPEVKDNGDDTYTVTYSNLPKFDKDGKEIKYTVSESAIEGYASSDKTVAKSGATLTNIHTVPLAVDPPVATKVVKGDKPASYSTFVFQLVADKKNPNAPLPADAKNGVVSRDVKSAAEPVSTEFGSITLTEPGTYLYDITEVKGNEAGWTYDPSTYVLTIEVTKGDDGQLTAEEHIALGEKAVDKVEFTNTYKAAEPSKPATTKPSQPKQTTTTSSSTTVNKAGQVVSTGDTINTSLLIAIGALAVAAVAGGVALKRRAK